MEELLSAVLELAWECRRAKRRLGALVYRTRPRRWPWLAALAASVPVAWAGGQWGWLGVALGLAGCLALILSLAWAVYSREYAVGQQGLLIEGAFFAWSDLVSCRLLADDVVECRTGSATQQFRVPTDFVEPLRRALLDRGIDGASP